MHTNLFLPVYLAGRLRPRHSKLFAILVAAIGLATESELKNHQIEEIREMLKSFVKYYDEAFYTCRPVIHQILHVADALRDIGPMFEGSMIFWYYGPWTTRHARYVCYIGTPRRCVRLGKRNPITRPHCARCTQTGV